MKLVAVIASMLLAGNAMAGSMTMAEVKAGGSKYSVQDVKIEFQNGEGAGMSQVSLFAVCQDGESLVHELSLPVQSCGNSGDSENNCTTTIVDGGVTAIDGFTLKCNTFLYGESDVTGSTGKRCAGPRFLGSPYWDVVPASVATSYQLAVYNKDIRSRVNNGSDNAEPNEPATGKVGTVDYQIPSCDVEPPAPLN